MGKKQGKALAFTLEDRRQLRKLRQFSHLIECIKERGKNWYEIENERLWERKRHSDFHISICMLIKTKPEKNKLIIVMALIIVCLEAQS
jgi:hypothetical protein